MRRWNNAVTRWNTKLLRADFECDHHFFFDLFPRSGRSGFGPTLALRTTSSYFILMSRTLITRVQKFRSLFYFLFSFNAVPLRFIGASIKINSIRKLMNVQRKKIKE